MAVFQCREDVHLQHNYERYNLLKGQLLAVNASDLISYIEKHHGFVEVQDDELIRLAPPLYLIRQPEDPYRMRKEDMISELRSYGIKVDPYDFCQKLTMQLTLARKMLKRNFLTVLNKQGYPVFIDSLQMPVPVLNEQDDTLSEPDEVNIENGEFYEPKIKETDLNIKEYIPPKPIKEKPLRENEAMIMEPTFDEKTINEGMEFDEFIQKTSKKEYIVPIEIEKALKPVSFEPKDSQKPYIFTGNPNDFKYLVETNDKRFLLKEEKIERELLGDIKWTKINIDVFETFLRQYDIKVDYIENDVKKRWEVITAAKKVLNNSLEQEKCKCEILMLQKRHNEIVELEPSYRDFTKVTLRRRVTELSRYGVNVFYNKNTNIKKYARKVFALAKLGLQVPEIDEEINKKLIKYNRSSSIK